MKRDIGFGLLAYVMSSGMVLLGVLFGFQFVEGAYKNPDHDFIDALTRFDGSYYRDIATKGYWWDPEKGSGVAFFPAYPVLIAATVTVTHARVELIQVVLAHVFLLISMILLHSYSRLRFRNVQVAGQVVLAFAVLPTTFFFRMGYSESLFFLVLLLYLLGIERRWSLLSLALICGLASATRPPGIALDLAFLFEIRRRSPQQRFFTWRAVGFGFIGCWGLLAYMLHQWLKFGQPLAFVQTQKHWSMISGSFWEIVGSIATLMPIWATYDPDSIRNFHTLEEDTLCWWVFSLRFLNPVFFVGTVALLLLGWTKRLLNRQELIVSAGLVLIPYFTKAFAQSMGSFGRFAAVVLPVYLVMGAILNRLPPGILGLVVSFVSFWLIVYSLLFGAGFGLF